MKKLVLYLLMVFVILKLQVMTTGCAVIVPPEGGPRDSLPPVLEEASPPNNSKNFTGNRISFSFDEYIDLENYQQNVIVSPLPENMPTMTRKLNTITIKLRDSVQANTTYSFNFGNSIKDINEGNVMREFTYTISTGPYIDSLEFSGRVLLAETGEADSTLTVMLYKEKEDSAVINKRPRYITKVNSNGYFTFHHLSPGTFYVYSWKDAGSYRYLSTKELFAFANAPVQIGSNTDSVTLYAYASEPAATIPSTGGGGGIRGRANEKRLKFQTNAVGKMDLIRKFTFTFETPLRNFDSTKVRVVTDTTFTPITNFKWNLDSTRKKLSLDHQLKENTEYHVILEKDFATDTLGLQLLKSDTIHFATRSRDEYANIKLRFRNLDLTKNPVLQFIQGTDVRYSFPITAETFTQTLLEPGDYGLRVLYDANKNGHWDPGVFFGKHQQPEIAKPVARKTTTIRANFENQFEIVLP